VGFSEIEQQLLICVLIAKNYPQINFKIVQSHQYQFFPVIAPGIQKGLEILAGKKLLTIVKISKENQEEHYVLTKEGLGIARQLMVPYLDSWYSKILIDCAESAAHRKFCMNVFGIAVNQFSFFTLQEFEHLLAFLNAQKATRILDVGCGTGGFCAELAAYPEFKKIHGIDFAKEAIDYGNKKHAHLNQLNQLNQPARFVLEASRMEVFQSPDRWDAIIFIDTIYFTPDPLMVLEKYVQMLDEQGSLFLFFGQPLSYVQKFEEVLSRLNASVQIQDFTAEFSERWDRMAAALMALKDEFYAEGHEYLYRAYLEESERNVANRRGQQVRRFYQIKKIGCS